MAVVTDPVAVAEMRALQQQLAELEARVLIKENDVIESLRAKLECQEIRHREDLRRLQSASLLAGELEKAQSSLKTAQGTIQHLEGTIEDKTRLVAALERRLEEEMKSRRDNAEAHQRQLAERDAAVAQMKIQVRTLVEKVESIHEPKALRKTQTLAGRPTNVRQKPLAPGRGIARPASRSSTSDREGSASLLLGSDLRSAETVDLQEVFQELLMMRQALTCLGVGGH